MNNCFLPKETKAMWLFQPETIQPYQIINSSIRFSNSPRE